MASSFPKAPGDLGHMSAARVVGGRTFDIWIPSLTSEIITSTAAKTLIEDGDFSEAILYERLPTCRGQSSGLGNFLIACLLAPHIRHLGSSIGSLYLDIWW